METSKKSDKLFELINSMSMSEKRYFKLFGGRHSGNEKSNYLKMFEILEKMEAYNPDLLTKGLVKRKVSTRYLSSDKSYLYNLVLRSLSSFHWSKTAGLQIKEMLHQVEILYERGMADHCLKVLRKARSLAENHQLYGMLPEIERYEYRAASINGDLNLINDSLLNAEKTANILSNLRVYSSLHNQMYDYKRRYAKARTQVVLDEIGDLMRHPLLREETQPPSFWATFYYWETHAAYQYVRDSRAKELEANQQAVELLEAQPNYEQEFPAEYATVRSRILMLQSNLDDEAFNDKFIEFQQLPDRPYQAHHQINANIYINAYLAQMWRLVENKRFEEAFNLIPVMENMYETFEPDIPIHVKISYQYLFAYVYMTNGIYDRSLSHVNLLINEFSENDRPDLHAYVRLLSLMVHLELGNDRFLSYQLESTRRYLKSRDRLFEMEDLLLKAVRKVSAKPYDKDNILKRYLAKAETIFEDKFENQGLYFLDVKGYLQASLEKQTMAAWYAKTTANLPTY